MDQIDLVPILVRWVHIVASMLAIGGAAFLGWALVPASKEALGDEDREKLGEAVRRRWAKVVHASIALLLLTGAGNFVLLALRAGVKPMPYHALFGVKFLAAMGIFFLASALAGRSPGFEKMRQKPAGPLKMILVLGVLIVLLSGIMHQVRITGRDHSGTPIATTADVTDTP